MKLFTLSAAGLLLAGSAALAADDAADTSAQLFQSLDKNSDGTLQSDEVPEDKQSLYERLVRVGDEDKNGGLSQDEFVTALTQQDAPVEQPAAGPGGQGGGRGRPNLPPVGEMFDRMDANGDDKLTLAEFPEPMRERMEQMFDRLGKTELTREDMERARNMLGGGGAPGGGPPQGGDRGEFLKRMDRNNDGKLALSEVPEEMRARMQPMFDRAGGDEIDLEQLARMAPGGGRPGTPGDAPAMEGGPRGGGFALLDTDGDRRLSQDELAKAADKFGELDRNSDGYIDPMEMMGPPPGGEMRGRGTDNNARPGSRRPRRPEMETDSEQRPTDGPPRRRPE